MMTAEACLALGILALAFFVPVTSVEKVTIPKELKAVSARVSVSSTSCSVTCGLGFKVEETCQVNPNGERTNCTKHRLDCLSNWICGMRHFTVLVGKPFELSCLTPYEIHPEMQGFSYTWRLARGIITTDDALFLPFKTKSFAIKLSPAEEYDAGTYRCDVQLMKNYKLVKRIYFGLRVIPGHLVELNFDKSLTSEQKLDSGNAGSHKNTTTITPGLERWSSWQQRAVFVFVVGIGSGMIGGVLLHTVFYYLLKVHGSYEYEED
ncbi:transmembrane protein 81 [Varanus komodoensis]|uniref:Transmembrane protein 81 n=1 Tax=Varanus komodoensis TaxID=61221 RepID=A0A8D2LBG4_VARKO|nr:transmembrane protein 81 [Varanus komodoensis]